MRTLICAALAAASLVVPAQTASAGACGAGGRRAGADLHLHIGCQGSWELSVTGGTGVLTPPYSFPIGDLTGPCTTDRCRVAGSGYVYEVSWEVVEHRPGQVAGVADVTETEGPPSGLAACGWASADGIGPDDDGVWTGEIDGGPVVAPGSTVSMRCSVHYGVDVPHTTPVVTELTAGPSPHAAYIPPTVVSFPYDEWTWFSICSEVTVDGKTWYWGYRYYGFWTTDPNVACTHSTLDWRPEPELVPVIALGYIADGFVCLPFAVLFPPEGDVAGLWDCPPYEE